MTSVTITAPTAGTQKIGAKGTGAVTVVTTGGAAQTVTWSSSKAASVSVVAGTGAWEVLPAATVGEKVTLTATSTVNANMKDTVEITVGAPDLASVTFAADKGTLTGTGKNLTLTLAAKTDVVTLTPTGVPAKSVVPAPTNLSSADDTKATVAAGTGTGNTNKLVITGVDTAATPGVAIKATYGAAGEYTINVIVP